MFGIGALLLNTLCIILSIFAYDLIAGRRAAITLKLNRVLLSILGCVCAIVCITFPVTLMTGFTYHLSPIPLLISILYGGIVPGLFTAASILIYGWIHGGTSNLISIVTLGVQVGLALSLTKQFGAGRLRTKFWLGGGLILVENVLKSVAGFIIEPTRKPEIQFSAMYLVISVGTLILAVYLIEYLKQNYYIRKELFQTERLKVISELAASIAHEVRNPMTAVRGFAQLLSQDPHVKARHYEALSVMISELDRAHEIISDYLDFAGSQPDNTHTINLSQQVRHVVQILTPYANSKSVSIDETSEDSLYVVGNASRFYQAMMNIIKNAIESMPKGGSVFIRACRSKHHIELEIADEGCGMTESDLSRLGTPFYSTKSNGTGLGLTSTYQCVHTMHGTIQVKSRRDEGTTFKIAFPAGNVDPVAPNHPLQTIST